jgi:hypothetical protein
MPIVKYQRAFMPCSHHSRPTGGCVVANSIAYLEGWISKLYLPPNGRIGGD